MKLDDRKWKEYKVGEIFENIAVRKNSKVPDCEGMIPFVSSTSLNNGVNNFCDVLPVIENAITVSTNGACFDCFYHDYPIAVSNDVEVLWSDKLNKFVGLFICTILKQEKIKWSYGRKPKNNKVFKTIISLPSNSLGEPDWQFMEDYIKEIWGVLNTSIPYTKQKLDISNWKEFKIGNYFEVRRGKRIVKNVDFFDVKNEEYRYPVVTAATSNNSIDGYFNNYNCDDNAIVCGGEAGGFYATYQEEKCWVMDRSRIFLPYSSVASKINKFTSLFLVTIFKKEMFKYSYGRSANPRHIMDTVIKLPVDNCGEPDWQFMEEYIKKLEFSDLI